MKKVVRSISVKHKRESVRLIGYASSDRGTRIVAAVADIDTTGKSKTEVNTEVKSAIDKMLAPQLDAAPGRTDLPGGGG